MTDKQEEVLERVFSELGEHFQGVVIAVVADVEEADTEQEVPQYCYSGGRLQAIGLCAEAIRHFQGVPRNGEWGPEDS